MRGSTAVEESGCVCPVSEAPERVPLEVAFLVGGAGCAVRLAEMGIVPGAKVMVLRRGCPLLVGVGNARYALGEGMMSKVMARRSVS